MLGREGRWHRFVLTGRAWRDFWGQQQRFCAMAHWPGREAEAVPGPVTGCRSQ